MVEYELNFNISSSERENQKVPKLSEAKMRANNKWNRANYEYIQIFVPKGEKDKIKAYATERGMSLNEFINNLIKKEMESVSAMENEKHICCLCGKEFNGFGNNPSPLADVEKRCCDECNAEKVIPARIAQLTK